MAAGRHVGFLYSEF